MFTSELRVFVGAALIVAGCAGRDDQDPSATSIAVAAETTPTIEVQIARPAAPAEIYLTLLGPQPCPDVAARGCAAGFWVHEVNRPYGLEHVSGFDVDHISREALDQLRGGIPSLILGGRYLPPRGEGDRVFDVLEVWRGLPDVGPLRWNEAYWAPVREENARVVRRLNQPFEIPVDGFDVAGFAPSRVDEAWLLSRVTEHGALVAGRLQDGRLEASQVFVRLPDVIGPCPLLRLACGTRVETFARDDNRCLVPTGCVQRELCPAMVPGCAPGYVLASWPSEPGGCLAFACDPGFLDR